MFCRLFVAEHGAYKDRWVGYMTTESGAKAAAVASVVTWKPGQTFQSGAAGACNAPALAGLAHGSSAFGAGFGAAAAGSARVQN